MSMDAEDVREMNEWIAFRLEMVESIRSGQLRDTAISELSPQVRAEWSNWHDQVLRSNVRPEQDPRGTYSVHLATDATWDVIRSKWSIAGREFIAFDDSVCVTIWSRPERAPLDESTALGELSRFAAFFLNQTGAFAVRPPTAGEAGGFSTAPARTIPTMPFWHSRIDGGVRNGVLYLLVWKRKNQLMGFDRSATWFDDDFRRRMTMHP